MLQLFSLYLFSLSPFLPLSLPLSSNIFEMQLWISERRHQSSHFLLIFIEWSCRGPLPLIGTGGEGTEGV